jgi:ribose transport system substrate-binding protein
MQLLPEGGTVALIAGPAGAFWASGRTDCFVETVEKNGFEVVAKLNGEQDIAVALSQGNDILQRFPDVDMIYAVGDTTGAGAARAVQQAGKCGDVKVVIAVLSEPVEELMKQGCIQFVVGQKPVAIARGAVTLADGIINGTEERGQIISIPNDLVTPENLATIDIDNIRQPKGWRP